MATTKGKKSPLQQMIQGAVKEMHSNKNEFPEDPTLETDGEIRTGPARFAKDQKTKDEIVIDKLLAPIQNKSGYFMKLKKELRPGEWMLMKTIENDWRKWADIETEVANIVKAHTVKAPSKWGSGPYRIEYGCTSGLRGETYPDVDMFINAEEEYLPASGGVIIQAPVSDPAVTVSAQIDTLANLVGMLKNFLPQQIDPAKTQEQIAAAFQNGLQIKAQENTGSKDMMATVMTGMMGMMTALMTRNDTPRVVNPAEPMDQFKGMLETLKTFGVLGSQQEKQKTTIDFITELKALGMDLFEKKDPIAQIGQLKQLASIAGEFMGMGGSGEKPGILEKLVDTLAPVLPGMIKDLKDTAQSAQQVQVEAGRNIERARIGAQPQSPAQGNTMNVGTSPAMSNPQIVAFFNGLYEAVNMNNRMFYPVIYTSLLQDAKGQALLQGIADGTQTAKEVIEMLQEHGGERYRDSEFVMKRLVGYTNGFIMWIRDMMKPKATSYQPYAPEMTGHENIRQPGEPKPQGSTTYDAECQLCHTIYAFESEQDFIEEENKTCEITHNGVLCPGVLQPMQKAS